MICHLSLAIALFNLALILLLIRRVERRRATAEATDRVLASMVRSADRAPTGRSS